MLKIKIALVFLLVFSLPFLTVVRSYAAAGINRTVNFQGRVVNKTDGTNVADGNYTFVFKIYDASTSGTKLWGDETQTNVPVTSGIFTVSLGSVRSFATDSLDFNQDNLWLDVTFNGESFGTRVRLTAVPYALTAEKVNGLTVTQTTGTFTLTNGKTFSVGNTLTLNGTDSTTFTFPSTSGGTVHTSNAPSQTFASTQSSGTVLGISDSTALTGAIKGLSITLSGTNAQDQTGLEFNLSNASGSNLNDIVGTGSTWKVSKAGALTVSSCTGCGAGGGYATVQDEGSGLTARTTINFTGAGVSCADNAGSSRTDCTIASGGSGPWTDGSGVTYLTDTAENLAIGSTTASSMLQVGSATNRGSVDVYGDITKKSLTKQTALANINDVFVYDTSQDSNVGYWRKTQKIKQMSWYTETKDDGPGDACNVSTDDRCGDSEFPEKTVIVTTNDAVYLFDALTMKMWMKFTQGGTFTLGADANNNPSGAFAINGVVYIATNGSSGTGLYAIDFINDRTYKYNTSNRSQGDKNLANRNTTVTYNIDSQTKYAIPDNIVNDVYGALIEGASVNSSMNGDLVLVIGSDTAVSAIFATGRQLVTSYSDVTGDDYNSVWITKRGRIFALNETQGQLEKWLNLESNSFVNETNGAPDKLWDESSTAANLPNISPTAPTIPTSPDALSVIERTSLSDDASDTVYVGLSTGLAVIQTNATTETSGWVKRYTKDYITEEMIGDTKAMFTFHQASGDYVDVSRLGNVLDVKGSPTYGANGVRGTGASFDNTNDILCSDANNDTTCDNDTDYNVGTAGFIVSGWFKHSTSAPASGTDVIISKRLIAAPATVAGWEVYMDTSGRIAFAVDDDTTWGPCVPATDDCAISPSGVSYADGQWHHFMATRTTGATAGFYLFLDGKLANSDTSIQSTLTLDGGSILSIGGDCSVQANCLGADYWDGQIDDIAFSTTGNTTSANLIIYARRLFQEGRAAAERKTLSVLDSDQNSSTTIGKTGQTWTPNELIGSMVEITGGTGIGQTREIVANTATTMTVSPAWTTSPDSTSDFAVNPEELYGASDNVRAIGIADVFVGEHRKVYVGTNDGSDGGGVTVFNNVGYIFATDIYQSGAKKLDDSSSEWTGTDYDDIQAIADTNGATTMGSLGALWAETNEFSLIETEDRMQSYLGRIRIELRNDGLGGISPEQGYIPGVDLAEYYHSNEDLSAGDVVSIDPISSASVVKSTSKYQKDVLGIVATQPGIVLGGEEEGSHPVALVGRVPVKVTTENGVVKAGDYVTAGSYPGYGMRASEYGKVIGQALEDFTPSEECGDEEPICRGTVLVFVNSFDYGGESVNLAMDKEGFDLPASELPVIGGIDFENNKLAQNQQKVLAFLRNKISKSGDNFSEINVGRITALDVISPQLVTDLLIAKKIKAESIEGLEVWTNKIGSLEDKLAQEKKDPQSIVNLQNSAIEDSVASLSATLSQLKDFNIASSSSLLKLSNGIMVSGSSWFDRANVETSLVVGLNLTLSKTSIDTIGEPLEIQSLGQAPISFMKGYITVDTGGNLKVYKNASFASDVSVEGVLSVHTVKGIDDNLNVSGSATFEKVGIKRGSFEPISDDEVRINTSAGTVKIKSGKSEIKIDNDHVSSDSLIFITPRARVNASQLYIKSQEDKSLTVGLDNPSDQDIEFNFLIVN